MSPADKMQQIRVAHGQTIARMSCLVESPILHRQRYVLLCCLKSPYQAQQLVHQMANSHTCRTTLSELLISHVWGQGRPIMHTWQALH